jgi:hypothetical protein
MTKQRAKPKAVKARPSRKPQEIDDQNWYYEHPGSILLVHEEWEEGGKLLGTAQIRISWCKLMTSAWRCGRHITPARKSKKQEKK